MDLSKIKDKLNKMETRSKNKVDLSKVLWKPPMGESVVRIVPSVYSPEYPFTELDFHYNIGKYPMIALTNFNKQDPIVEFVKELKKTDDKDNWSLAGKIKPKTRVFAPVIIRGEEDKGVRLWGFGITIYKALLGFAEDEDIGDFTDITEGWDLKVKKSEGNPYPETTINIKPKQVELSEDNNQVEKWLKEQPNPKEIFTQYDYDFIKKQLNSYLNPDSGNQEDATENTSKDNLESSKEGKSSSNAKQEQSEPEAGYKLENKKESENTAVKKFDKLFED